MQTVLVQKENIKEYIPQKDPIVLIDTIDYCEDALTKTSFKIEANHVFVKNGYLQEAGLIENIAQTAAAKAGYEVKKHGLEPLLGFIGAVKDLKIYNLPAVGEILTTSVEVKMEIMGVTLIYGTSEVNGKKMAECEMKIVIQKPEEKNV